LPDLEVQDRVTITDIPPREHLYDLDERDFEPMIVSIDMNKKLYKARYICDGKYSLKWYRFVHCSEEKKV